MGSASDRIYDSLQDQADSVRGAARALHALVDGSATVRESVHAAARVDDEATAARLRLEQTLFGTLRAPIDRDDLHGLCCELDGVRRSLTRTMRAFASAEIEPPTIASPTDASQLLVRSSDDIHRAVGQLRQRAYGSVVGTAGQLRRTRREARTLYHDALRRVLETDERDPRVLFDAKGRLERVDELVVQCAAVGARLAYVAVKNQ